MPNKKVCQVIAIEKEVKNRVHEEITALHRISNKPDLFNGFMKNYRKKDEEGDEFPNEKKKVQMSAIEHLMNFTRAKTSLLDITATKDWGNTRAYADIVIDGELILNDVPTPFLLFLEKEIHDIRSFIENIPIQDESEDWVEDTKAGIYKTEASVTHKTKKIHKPIELSPATKEHRAQVELASFDEVIGYWDTIKSTGAMPAERKKEILEKLGKFTVAVKSARELANTTEVDDMYVGKKIFDFILS